MNGKMKLALDTLSVDSFDTTAVAQEKGTVFGEQCTCYTQCNTCPVCPTCAATCAYTCDDYTCIDTCGRTCWDTCGGTCGV